MHVNNFLNKTHDEAIHFLDVIMDQNRFEVTVKQKPVDLTFTEFKLLEYLICHADRAVSREELLKEIWAIPESIETRATDDMVKRLRKKLKAANADAMIVTVRGFGFMIAKNHHPKLADAQIIVPAHELHKTIDYICSNAQNNHSAATIKIKKLNDQYIIDILA
ncbi:winged helix-turn-helix transcriptional regulator [Fusibacter paucivorans]|uniref:Winged helix-turn-helix transcriptional regulator n=1 Tax=Fusibacter paucivorans TaxID=76009 RepID=A0ABS5PQ89_9FIRM|nr:winged helix-turn-helix domain-containing protein [Fusibacter paucivorans]MBS7527333.1 winged helix-turn-helix transcriptional regulator [Fusibacter paucivorans]